MSVPELETGPLERQAVDGAGKPREVRRRRRPRTRRGRRDRPVRSSRESRRGSRSGPSAVRGRRPLSASGTTRARPRTSGTTGRPRATAQSVVDVRAARTSREMIRCGSMSSLLLLPVRLLPREHRELGLALGQSCVVVRGGPCGCGETGADELGRAQARRRAGARSTAKAPSRPRGWSSRHPNSATRTDRRGRDANPSVLPRQHCSSGRSVLHSVPGLRHRLRHSDRRT